MRERRVGTADSHPDAVLDPNSNSDPNANSIAIPISNAHIVVAGADTAFL